MRVLVYVLAVCCGLPFAGFAAARDFSAKWAEYAGEHMARAEVAGTCVGYRLNGRRRDEILELYRKRNLDAALERARVAMRAQIAAPTENRCRELLALFGPSGLLIRNYVLSAVVEDISAVPGPDRGADLSTLDPYGVESLMWLHYAGVAQAIEAVCTNHVTAPVVETYMYLAGHKVGRESAMSLALSSFFATAEKYKLKSDRPGFCRRVLADFGPASDTPVVATKGGTAKTKR